MWIMAVGVVVILLVVVLLASKSSSKKDERNYSDGGFYMDPRTSASTHKADHSGWFDGSGSGDGGGETVVAVGIDTFFTIFGFQTDWRATTGSICLRNQSIFSK